MPSPSRGAPPPTDRTPLLAQIDRSLSRSLGRTPTRRSLGRTKSHDRPAAGREDVPALPEDLDEPGASEFIVPTTLGEVVEARDDDDDDDNEAKDEDAVDGGSGDAGTALSRRWRLARSRARYYVPITRWLPSYTLEFFTGDAIAGVTLACLLIPQGISYASALAHLTPIAGLYCAVVPMIIYAVLGTCNQLSVGAEAALCLLVGNAIDDIWADVLAEHRHRHREVLETEQVRVAVDVATMLAFQVGIITFALGLFRLGFLDVVLSRALLKGFITAVGVVIFVEQMIGMLGLHPVLKALPHVPATTVAKFRFVVSHLGDAHKLTMLVAFGTLAFLVTARLFKRATKTKSGFTWLKFVPEILVGVVITTLLTDYLELDKRGLLVLGKVDGLSEGSGGRSLIASPLRASTLKWFSITLPTAAVISVIGFVDSIVAAKENASRYGYSISPNRELVALGAANIVSSVFGGLPSGFGSLTRSRLAGEFGARTPMAGVVTAAVIVFSMNFLLGSLFFLPKCVLSAIVLLVIYGILIEAPEEIHFYVAVSAWKDMAQFWLTFLLTLFVGVETGLVSSVIFSLILVVSNSTQPRITILGHVDDDWVPLDEHPGAQEDVPGVLVVRIRDSLNFANTGQLKERLRRLELYGPGKAHPSEAPRRDEATVLVMHMGDMESIDASALAIFSELAKSYRARGVSIYFTHLRTAQRELFTRAGLVEFLGAANFQPSVEGAISSIEDRGLSSGINSQ